MIKAIIFDFGSVVYRTDWKKVNEFFKERNGFGILIQDTKDEEIIRIYKESDVGKEDLKKIFLRMGPKDLDMNKILKDYKEAFIKFKILNTEMVKIINELKDKYTLFGFTDVKKEHFEANKDAGIYDGFKKIFTSFSLMMLKANKNAFEFVVNDLKNYDIKPSECIFIDDHLPNIENARHFGFKTIHYTDFPNVSGFEKEIHILLQNKN